MRNKKYNAEIVLDIALLQFYFTINPIFYTKYNNSLFINSLCVVYNNMAANKIEPTLPDGEKMP